MAVRVLYIDNVHDPHRVTLEERAIRQGLDYKSCNWAKHPNEDKYARQCLFNLHRHGRPHAGL